MGCRGLPQIYSKGLGELAEQPCQPDAGAASICVQSQSAPSPFHNHSLREFQFSTKFGFIQLTWICWLEIAP